MTKTLAAKRIRSKKQPVVNERLKAALRARGATYWDAARLADVSWNMVWCVVNGRKTSAPVLAALHKLAGFPPPGA